jgi:hypothetical protein
MSVLSMYRFFVLLLIQYSVTNNCISFILYWYHNSSGYNLKCMGGCIDPMQMLYHFIWGLGLPQVLAIEEQLHAIFLIYTLGKK